MEGLRNVFDIRLMSRLWSGKMVEIGKIVQMFTTKSQGQKHSSGMALKRTTCKVVRKRRIWGDCILTSMSHLHFCFWL